MGHSIAEQFGTGRKLAIGLTLQGVRFGYVAEKAFVSLLLSVWAFERQFGHYSRLQGFPKHWHAGPPSFSHFGTCREDRIHTNLGLLGWR